MPRHNKNPCEMCGKIFNKSQMRKHMLQIHTENDKKPFICELCGKGFINKQKLKYHMNTHTGNKPFVCDLCGTGFAHKANMRVHIKAHKGIRRQKKTKVVNPEGTNLL